MTTDSKKHRGRWKPITYLRLTLILAVLAIVNYVFNKVADMLYGKSDLGSILGFGILIFGFIFGFAVFFWLIDRKGSIGRILGAEGEEPS